MSDFSMFDLQGKKALVTGGTAGIGRACALALAMAGAEVAIVGRRELVGIETAAMFRKTGYDVTFVPGDVSQAASVEDMMHAVVSRFGRLDIAVNNAGTYIHGDEGTQSKDEWDQVIGVNLTGTWLCARAEMLQMTRQVPTEGKIINIGSIGATIACSNGSYDASKAGVVHLTRTLAARWGRYNINVNCISPGYIETALGGSDRTREERERIREVTPLGHIQRTKDLYGAIVFFASQASDYVTGQNLVVDGGHTLGTWLEPLKRNCPPRVDEISEMEETGSKPSEPNRLNRR